MPEQNPENILRRAEDLARRCVRQDRILSSSFLTPAEQSVVQGWVHRSSLECIYNVNIIVFHSGKKNIVIKHYNLFKTVHYFNFLF